MPSSVSHDEKTRGREKHAGNGQYAMNNTTSGSCVKPLPRTPRDRRGGVSKYRQSRMFDLTTIYAERCREYERLYLSAALKYPVEALDTAVKSKLTNRSFAYAEHRMIFGWLCVAAGKGHTFTLESFRAMNQRSGFPLHPVNVAAFWWEEIVPTGLEAWARKIKNLEGIRILNDRLKRIASRNMERIVA